MSYRDLVPEGVNKTIANLQDKLREVKPAPVEERELFEKRLQEKEAEARKASERISSLEEQVKEFKEREEKRPSSIQRAIAGSSVGVGLIFGGVLLYILLKSTEGENARRVQPWKTRNL